MEEIRINQPNRGQIGLPGSSSQGPSVQSNFKSALTFALTSALTFSTNLIRLIFNFSDATLSAWTRILDRN